MTVDVRRRCHPATAAAGPQVHRVLDLLADGGQSYQRIAGDVGVSKPYVGKVYKDRHRHQLDTWPLVEDGQPVPGFNIEGCRYCGAWRRWRNAADGRRYVTEWAQSPPPCPAPASLGDLSLTLRDRRAHG